MYQRHLLSDSDVERLGAAVVRILEQVGILIQNRDMLAALEAWGARVDFAAQTCHVPAALTEEFVAGLRGERPMPPLGDEAFRAPGLPALGTQIAQLVHDYETGRRRAGNRDDFIRFAKLGEMLHPAAGVGHFLLLTDVPPAVEPMEAALLLAEHTSRPQGTFAWRVDQVDYLLEMGDILGYENWFTYGAVCFAHPFRFDRDVADKFVRRVREGVSTGLTAMPVAGLTTPLAPAGFVAVGAAEIVATWLAARALNPTVPLHASMWPGSLDMKTGEVSYCSFDSMHAGFAASELLRRWAHQPVSVGGGEYCDAKEPGYYAAFEKAYKSMLIAAFSGRHPGIGQGMLEEGKTLSAVQLLLEREVSEGIGFLGRPLEVTPESLGLEAVLDIGFGLAANHLQRDETLDWYRQLAWCPALMDRSGWRGAATDRAVLDRCHGKVHELLAEYRRPEVDPYKLAAMRQVIERAKRELAG